MFLYQFFLAKLICKHGLSYFTILKATLTCFMWYCHFKTLINNGSILKVLLHSNMAFMSYIQYIIKTSEHIHDTEAQHSENSLFKPSNVCSLLITLMFSVL